MTNHQHHNLASIIYYDLVQKNKLTLLLFILVIISAILIVKITYQTRCLITKYEQLLLEQNVLDIEWRNLILEENVLGNHSHIEYIARKKFKMHYVNSLQENIIIQSSSVINRSSIFNEIYNE